MYRQKTGYEIKALPEIYFGCIEYVPIFSHCSLYKTLLH